jgi:oligoribonuclease
MIGIFLDTETNGLNPYKHRILEIAFKIVDLISGDEIDKYEKIIFQSEEIWERSDPKSLEINGFTWKDITTGISEKKVSEEIISLFDEYKIRRTKAVFICQNPSFDRLFFSQIIAPEKQDKMGWPYHWLDLASMFWALTIKKAKNKEDILPWDIGLSKDAIAEHYNLPKEAAPHKAMNGVTHLLSCYKSTVGFIS